MVAGDPDKRLVRLAALRDQKGMRKDHRKSGREPDGVEIVGTLRGRGIRHNFEPIGAG